MKSLDEARTEERSETERRAKTLFDESVERLDGRTRSKLTQARNAALEELQRLHDGSVRSLLWYGLGPGSALAMRLGNLLRRPLTGLSAAIVAVLALFLWQGHERAPGMPPLDDLEIVADVESLDMLQEVEFYAWLDQR